MSSKVTRRKAIKALAAAGAFVAATPYLARVSGATTQTSAGLGKTSSIGGKEPLVIVVKRDELIGFIGEEELRVDDRGLISTIQDAFGIRSAE